MRRAARGSPAHAGHRAPATSSGCADPPVRPPATEEVCADAHVILPRFSMVATLSYRSALRSGGSRPSPIDAHFDPGRSRPSGVEAHFGHPTVRTLSHRRALRPAAVTTLSHRSARRTRDGRDPLPSKRASHPRGCRPSRARARLGGRQPGASTLAAPVSRGVSGGRARGSMPHAAVSRAGSCPSSHASGARCMAPAPTRYCRGTRWTRTAESRPSSCASSGTR